MHSCARARAHTRTHTGGLETVQPPCGAAPGQPEHAPSPACAFSRACAEMSMCHTRRNARADKGAYTQREPRQTAAGGGGGGGGGVTAPRTCTWSFVARSRMPPSSSKPLGRREGAPGDFISAASAPGFALYLMREFVLAAVNKAPGGPLGRPALPRTSAAPAP